MESRLPSIQTRAQKLKEKIFSSNVDLYSLVCPSAYNTAWLAMIPDSQYPTQPMFKNFLDWLLNNQHPEGFWGEDDTFGKPTVESLPATLVSMVALKKWNTGASLIQKGLSFIDANAEKLLDQVKDDCPRRFAIVLPAMCELADTVGLQVVLSEAARDTISYISRCRNTYLNKEELVVGNSRCYPPLLSYLEALPTSYVREEDTCSNLSGDGSLFQSPSATAKAFMATGKQECLTYLQSLARRCPNGVPQAYPMDEDLIKLCIVNQLQKLGLGEYFVREIDVLLAQVYRNYNEQNSWVKASNMIAAQLHKDSLAFQLLRMHGYHVSPLSFCWFLHHDDIRAQIEKNYEHFSSAMLHVFRASNLMFYGECELEEASNFSRKFLEKTVARNGDLQRQIKHELNAPCFARLDHLEHRMWMEEKEANALWNGKTSYNRISYLYNDELLQLATQNFEFKQTIFKNELEELKRWCEELGISKMGFGREKTTYCYFGISAVCPSLPHDSYVRMLVAKSAIIVTVADDFFDMVGSLSELEVLTDAVGRWDSKGLSSHSKVIFDALDSLVSEANAKYLQQEGTTNDILSSLQDLWYETFLSWLMEAKWSRNGHAPSIDSYIKTGMTSIAAQTLVLPASCFVKPSLPNEKLRPTQYEPITKLLMVICRLLNDVQSFQREKEEEGKLNSVFVQLIKNPELDIEDSIAFVKGIIGKKKREFLEHVLIDGVCDLPKTSKDLHLSCLKIFQMFYDSKNRYDSNTEMLEDINKAIYLPVRTTKESLSLHSVPKKKYATAKLQYNLSSFKHNTNMNFTALQVSPPTSSFGKNGCKMVFMGSKIGLGFV